MDEQSWREAVRDRARSVMAAVDRWAPVRVSALVRRIADRDLLTSASSLAFYGLVSALPLLLITFAVVETVTGDGTLQRFAEQVSQSGPKGTSQLLDQLARSGGSLTVVTLVFTLWPATAYGAGLRRTLSRDEHADSDGASGLRGRLIALGLVFVLPALILAGLPLMFFLSTLGNDGPLATLLGWSLALGSGAVVGTLLTTALYHAFTPRDLGVRESLRGAALTAAATGIFSLLFVAYLKVGNTGERFGGGTIALVVLLGVWLFVANILLLGGYETVLELHESGDRASDGRDG